jgi:hypothetical protein
MEINKAQLLEMLVANASDPAALAKAMQEALGLNGIRIIKDLWADGEFHKNPERDTTKTGPAMHSSGSGADRAMDEYSNPAPQIGMVEQYDMFTRKNIEGWGEFHSAMKSTLESFSKEFKDALSVILQKAEEMKEEEKEEAKKSPDPEPDPDPKAKSPDPEPDPDPKSKSTLSVAALWEALGDVEEALSKAEEHDEKKDVEGLEEAREHIEKAEHALEAVESHEKKEMAHQESMKAQVSINLAWSALMKATRLSRYDLHGYGNQVDAQTPGDETKDRSKHDLKAAKSKAKYFDLKVKALEKSLGLAKNEDCDPGMKSPDPEPDPDPKAKSPDPEPDPDPKSKAEIAALKAEVEKQQEFAKAANTRLNELNKRIESVTGHSMPPMTLITMKGGVKSDALAKAALNYVDEAYDAGELDDECAGMARNLIDRYQAAGKGLITVDIVDQQRSKAPQEVQNFFARLEQRAN